ncbi:MAG TPA: ABC transporter substrate-binding protein [Chloroflexota bacterium]|nr:ABC transporter substrate-binding protein [Chloroflexota bacterium]
MRLLWIRLAAVSIFLLAACAPSPAPPAAKPTEPPKPAAPVASPAASPAASPGASPAASPKPAGEAPKTGPARLSDGKIVFGVINDMSGVYADLSGQNAVKAVQMAIDDFEAKYGKGSIGGPIEVISADHQNKPDLANSKAQEFYDRNSVDVILDVPTSSAALAIAGVAKEKKRLYINVTAATTELTGPQCNKYTFHYTYDTWMLANGTGTEVTKSGSKKWYIVYPNYAYGQDMDRSFQAAIKAAGGEIVASDGTPFPNPGNDFSSFLLKAPSLKPDVLGTMNAGGELVNVVKQYNEFRLKDQGIKLAIGLLFDTDIHALGPDAFAGTLYTTPWIWTLDDKAREWADKYRKLVGGDSRPTFSHAGNYSAATQYLEAVRRAGTDDADAVAKALEGQKIDDFFLHNGLIRAEDHRVVHDAYLAEVKPQSEVKEPWDYSKILSTIPADKAFRPISEARSAGCNMQ